jgi:2-dehydro-3-deoxyphosphogluconate aldolase / (4S)-4-hydroxy-2-oxoglutarate aldolase
MRTTFDAAVSRHRLVAILRGVAAETLPGRVAALHGAGVRLIEVALSEATALPVLAELVRLAPPDMLVGAGTVTTRALAEDAHGAGATFLVTPHVARPTIEYAVEHDLGIIAGALTPTDIAAAREAGARFVKLFPASTVGPEYVKALLGPYPDLEILVVGGVSSHNLESYLRAGAIGVGVAGALAAGADAAGGYGAAAAEAARLLEILRAVPGLR